MMCPKRDECKYKKICSHWPNAEFCALLSDSDKKIEIDKKDDLKKNKNQEQKA